MNDKCETCDAGYFLAKPDCIPCPANCKTCDVDSVCVACNDGYKKGVGGVFCIKCTVANCKTCIDNHKTICDACLPGFGTSDGVACKACPKDCLECDQVDAADKTKQKCSKCKPDYNFSDTAACVKVENCKTYSKTRCSDCKDGYSPSKKGDKCVKCVVGAKKCGSNCAGSGLTCY